MEEDLRQIAKNIADGMGHLITKRVYVAIAGREEILYKDEEYDIYIDLIKSFMGTSFDLLKSGDHALPISSLPLMFFKINPSFAIILYSNAEDIKPGQFLVFKSQMEKYNKELSEILNTEYEPIIESPKIEKDLQIHIDQKIQDIAEKSEESFVNHKIKVVPYLLKQIKSSTKFELVDSVVLKLIEYNHSIEEIIKKSNLPREAVDKVINKYRERGLISIKIVEPEIKLQKNIKIYPRIKDPISFSFKVKKNERPILELCDGKISVDEIIEKTQFKEKDVIKILDKYEDQRVLEFFSNSNLTYLPKNVRKLSPMGVQLGLMTQKEFKIRELCTGDVTINSIAKTLELGVDELNEILKSMEEKGDIIFKVKKI